MRLPSAFYLLGLSAVVAAFQPESIPTRSIQKPTRNHLLVPSTTTFIQINARDVQSRDTLTSLALSNGDEIDKSSNNAPLLATASFAAIAIAYWYLLVFGAAAASSGLPVPDFIPLVPGWPPSDADLAPALEDSAHFFYIKDLLEGRDAAVPPVRLAVFNFAEAWIFAFLPALLADKKRLPVPAVFFAWTGGLGLTNAFLAPYLCAREAVALGNDDGDEVKGGKNAILSAAIGGIATAVVAYAGYDCITGSTAADWADFFLLAKNDRTYLAFLVDLVLFSATQSFLLRCIHDQQCDDEEGPMPTVYNIPFVGLMAWLLGA